MRTLLLVLGGVLGLSAQAADQKCDATAWAKKRSVNAKVQSTSDGDTLKATIRGSTYKVRLLSVDTPETNFQGRSQGVWGEAAKTRFKEFLPKDASIRIVFDKTPCDIYGRMLGYIEKDGVDLNRKLVEEGLAATFCVFPTTARCDSYAQALRDAMAAKRGFHADTAFELPYLYRSRESGRNEAESVASSVRKVAIPFERIKEIDVAERVFFLKNADLRAPYRLEE
jgi:endonuclease YncB( thermonuclease family)